MDNFFIDARNSFLAYTTTATDLKDMYYEYDRDFKKSNILNNKTVYDKKESRLAGILGEIVFQKYVGDKGIRYKNLSYDYIFNNKKIDVKCKFRSVIPSPSFEASFFSYQSSEYYKEVDYYAFLSTITGYGTVWFCAYSTKKNWLENPRGVLWKAGDIDPTNNKCFHKDTWSVYYKDLNLFSQTPTGCFL